MNKVAAIFLCTLALVAFAKSQDLAPVEAPAPAPGPAQEEIIELPVLAPSVAPAPAPSEPLFDYDDYNQGGAGDLLSPDPAPEPVPEPVPEPPSPEPSPDSSAMAKTGGAFAVIMAIAAVAM